MSNWDDEDYDPELASASLQNAWDDEIEEDAIADSWENALNDDNDQPKAPTRVRQSLKQVLAQKEAKEREELDAKALALKEEDAASRKERLAQIEQENDIKNLTDLMGAADVHPRALAAAKKRESGVAAASSDPSKLSDFKVFHPTDKAGFDTLRKTLVPIISDLSSVSSIHYPNLVTDMTRDLSKKLSQDQIRKLIATLNAVISEKQREERANRGKKPKAQLKGVSGKQSDNLDTNTYEAEDFGDDDFM